MEESEFWVSLKFRICAEFSGFEDRSARSYQCDGLVPFDYDFAIGDEPRILGLAYCGIDAQEQWQFTLVLTPGTASRDQIDWSALLPGERLTGWLWPDLQRKRLLIVPASGVPA